MNSSVFKHGMSNYWRVGVAYPMTHVYCQSDGLPIVVVNMATMEVETRGARGGRWGDQTKLPESIKTVEEAKQYVEVLYRMGEVP